MPASAPAVPASVLGAVHYQVEIADPHAHLFRVTLHLAQPQAQQTVHLPVWIPGSYLVREFAKHLQGLQATQNGQPCWVTPLDKASWQIDCNAQQPLRIEYLVYAWDNSVRAAWLDSRRGFFNGTSLLLRVPQCAQDPHTLELLPPPALPQWQAATALTPLRTDAAGFGLYSASDYDTLVDCPVEMGLFWSGSFEVYGVPHRFVVAGASESFDGAQLLADTQAICAQAMAFWHGPTAQPSLQPPFSHYLFLLNTVSQGYGGLEHRNSTALICARKDLPRRPRTALAPASHQQPEGYTTLLGLISHEYFHTWNVKRLRPAEFVRYDYSRENYTQLLWFFEGFTSYYDDLLLRRAQRLDNASYLQLLGKTINQVQQTPGRHTHSVAQASWDAWTKYYRPDENTPNATVSYYTKGALVALCLDLTLRNEGRTTLDHVMRALWAHCQGGPMREADLLHVLEQCAGRSLAPEIAQWVHSTEELPVLALLAQHGVHAHTEPSAAAQQLGLRLKDGPGVHLQHVMRGSAAEQAGFASGDEWLAVQALVDTPQDTSEGMPHPAPASGPWRMHSLDDLLLHCGNATQVQATIARDGLLRTLRLTLPAATHSVRLVVQDPQAVGRWLEGA